MISIVPAMVDWDALWRIVVAALLAGAGIVIVFGLLLLSLQRASAADSPSIRLLYRALAAVCGACCIAAVAFGIYAMSDKPSAKPAPKSAGLSGMSTHVHMGE